MFKYMFCFTLVVGCASAATISTEAICNGSPPVVVRGTTSAGCSWQGGNSAAQINANPAYQDFVDIFVATGVQVFGGFFCLDFFAPPLEPSLMTMC
jgi:hypothetical protein